MYNRKSVKLKRKKMVCKILNLFHWESKVGRHTIKLESKKESELESKQDSKLECMLESKIEWYEVS